MLPTILSVAALAGSAYSIHLALNPRPPPVPRNERVKGSEIFPTFSEFFRASLKVYQMTLYSTMFCEIGACILRAEGKFHTPEEMEQSMMLSMCPTNSLDSVLYPGAQLSPLLWFCCSCIISGALFRAWSVRSLGKFFTWEISIRPGHKLYTDGPYAMVRHPAYAGAVTIGIGQTLFYMASGTFVKECLGSRYPLAFNIGRFILSLHTAIGVTTIFRRTVMEDKLLKKEFGKEWEEWAKRVRYRLYPGVY